MTRMETQRDVRIRFSKELISLRNQVQDLSRSAEMVFWFYTKHDPPLFEKLTGNAEEIVEEFRDDFSCSLADMAEGLEILANRIHPMRKPKP